ncbi:hemagglutinin repeat-containing protein [Xenorhabdus budapestensis]|uniref:Hemagglutinin repeat-containing protein n=1 Tax=Xenorhabdus budapestensis TaxID=290110 RepID=A0ABX7VHW9_XENBU|nr:hemagglutinin repeat-containing protein [Xenorhabdus budapestensis]QTL40329.1 hemagglutinin repeat-containing protein [Xenorhabdus budapestensis]
MNKHCYRVIFNKTRQMLMVVSELVRSHTAGQARNRISVPSLSSARVALTPLVFGVSLALGLVSLSAQAGIVADNNAPGTQQPSVIATANGIPQINIQTPNGDGVSRNQYSQFDVAQRGAILNNSSINTQTELGGLITANPWLARGEAKIILNEVNSRHPSQLNGFIEVAGQRADVIIANPAGITCQGCGFINASQTTLAAGKTLLEGGRLKGFEVDEAHQGLISVEGKGLNDTGSDYTRLIGRAVNINARLHASHLTVTTGRNRVDAQGNVTEMLSESRKNKPAFSLDVAAVGGMYANKIKLVGTEQGVGVRNAGQLGAQAGNLTLDSQGKLTNSGVITASADVTINNQGALANQGNITAGVDKEGNRTQSGNLTIQSRGLLSNKGTIAASDNLTVDNQGDVTNPGRLSAGSRKPGSLKLNSGGHLANSGTIDASAEVKVKNQGHFINQGDITAGQDMAVNTRDHLDNQGRMLAGRHLDIHSASLTSHKQVRLPADRQPHPVLAAGADKDGKLTQPGNLTLDIRGKLDNQGIVTASDNIDIQNKAALTNAGDISAGKAMTIKTPGALTNQGKMLAGHHLDIQSASLESSQNGLLSAGMNKTQPGKLTLNSRGQLVNQGMMTATEDIVIEEPATLDNQGEINADRDIRITTSGKLTNQGKVLAGHHLSIQSAALESGRQGVLAAGMDKTQPGNLKIQSQSKLDNHGIIIASNTIHIENEGAFSHSGDMTAGGDMTIKAREHLDNAGKMRAGRHLNIHSAALVSRQNGLLAAGTDDRGNLTRPGNLIIDSRSQLVNQGVMTASDDIDIQNQTGLKNQGEVSAGRDIRLNTPGKLTNQGRVLAGHILDIHSADLENQQAGKLAAGRDNTQPGNLKIRSQGKLDNQGIITASESVHIENEGAFTHSGDITSGGDITLKARDALDNAGKMRAGRHLDIHSAVLVSHQNGMLAAGTDEQGNLSRPGNLIINSRGRLVNQGVMTASDDITLDNQAALENQGEVSAGRDIRLNTPGKLTNQGRVLAGHILDIHSADLDNQTAGMLAAGRDKTQPGNLKIRSQGKLDNQGIITASESIHIENEGAFTHSGDITAGGDITISAHDALDNAGKMRAGRHLDIHSAALVSHQNGMLAAGTDDRGNLTRPGNLIIDSRGQLVNQGVMTASDDIVIDNQAGLKNQGEVSAGRDIKLNTPGKLTNQGKVLAGHILDIQSADLDNQTTGMLAAGRDKKPPGTLKIQSQGKLDNQGIITASESIHIENEGAFTHSGDITSGGDITLKARDALDNAGKVLAGRHLNIHSAALVSHQNGMLAAGTDDQGNLTRPGNLIIDSRGQLVNQGVMTASDDITLDNQAALENQGEISADHDIRINTPGKLTNQGRVLAGHHLDIHSAALENQKKGELAAGTDPHGKPTQPGNLTLDSRGQLTNQGVMAASDDIVIDNQAALENAGEMSSGRDIRLKTPGHLVNPGKMLAGRHLNIHSASLSNQEKGVLAAGVDNKEGRLSQPGDLTLHSPGELTNRGVIRAFGDVTLPDQGNLMNEGDITAGQDMTITTRGHLDNPGRILAGRHLESQSTSLYSHQGSTLAAGMDNALRLTQHGNLTLKTTEEARLHGQNLAHDRLSVNAKDLSLAGSQTEAGDLTLTSDTQLHLQDAHVSARQHLTLSAPERIDNTRGRLRAETLTLRSQKLNNHQGKITQTGPPSLILEHPAGIDNTAGIIESRGRDLTLKAQTIANDNGRLIHAGTGVMALDTAHFQGKAGRLISDGELKLDGGDYHLVNSETSAQHITAHVQSLDHRLGKMTQQGTGIMALDVQHELDNGSGTISANGTVKVNAAALNNHTLTEEQQNNHQENPQKQRLDNGELNHQSGQIIAAEDGQLQVTVKNRLNNQQGQLVASAGMTVVVDEMDNRQGQITASNGDITLTTGQLTNTEGKIAGQHNLQLTAQAINNESGQIRAGTADIDTHQQQLNNTAGLIAAERQMTLRTGELLNRYGSIRSGQNLTIDTHGQQLDNRDSGQNGGVFSQGALRLTVADLNNQSGHIESHDPLNVSGNTVLNRHGQLLGGKDTQLRVDVLNNDQGLLQSGGKLTLNAKSLINRNSGDHNGITSKQAMVLNTGALNNERGVVASLGSLDITADNIINRQGLLAAQTRFALTGQRLDNQSGRITARQDLSVDTQGQTLDNTDGVIDSQAELEVKSGDLKNPRGTLHGKSATFTAKQLDNRQQGKILSEAGLRIDADALLNTQGQILALADLTARVTHHMDNQAGLIRSGGDAELSAQEIHNQDTQQQDNGIEGKNVIITADKLHNAKGQLFATENATLKLASALDNTQGQLQANRQLTVQGRQLAVTNTDGEIKAGKVLTVDADAATGDGKLRSLGDIQLILLKDFIHTGEIIANGRLRLSSQGNVINNGLISAGTLAGAADNLTNEATGKILADHHQWTVKNTLVNTGLLDGTQTYLRAAELTNQGTGRIYGDHIAIEAGMLNNRVDAGTKAKREQWFATKAGNDNDIMAKGQSAVIAARQRLDLGVGTLNNQAHSLIYSDGDFAFGGKLDDRYQASGKGQVINNHSAYIEAMGEMRLAAETINNVNDHFETELERISQTPMEEYQVWGQRYNAKNHRVIIRHDEVSHACVDNRGCRDNFQIYRYTRTTEETRVKETDPAKILAGKNLIIDTTTLTNDKSQVVAGGLLTVTGGDIHNRDVPGERYITDKGRVENFWRIRKKGRDRQGRGSSRYEPPAQIQAITLTPGTVRSSQGTVTLAGQRPADYQGTAAQMTPVRGGQINAGLTEAATPLREVALRPGQRLEVIIPPAAVTGQRPTITGGTAETPVIAGEKLTEPGKTFTVGEKLISVGEKNTGRDEKITNVGEKSIGVAEKITNVGEKPIGVAEKITNVGEKPIDVAERITNVGEKPIIIRTEVPNYQLPDNSLFKLNLPPDNTPPTPAVAVIDNLPLVETDPQFTRLKKWLGTDYMQQQLRWDHNNMHKRLGDGFYEQRLIREQVINLTGKRYLPGHQNDEEQFKALMNAGVRARHAFNLAPGIALNAEQMARLTEDMVWLVNATVTLPDGRQQTVRVPQVYVRTQAGSLDGTGALLSGRQVNVQLHGDLLNQGRIIGQDINILAENIRNQGGFVQGSQVDLQARTDMVQRGGTTGASQSLTIGAGHNIDIASTTRSGENQAGNNRFSATDVDNVARVYVQGADGKLHLRAGKDIDTSAAQLMSQGQHSEIQLDAGRDIQFGTAKTAQREHLEWRRDNYLAHTESGETGTDIHSAGQVSLRAGRDVNLRATGITAGKTLQVDAGRDVAVVAGEQQQTHDEYLKVKGSNSWVSSTTTTTREQYDRTQAVSSTLSGDTVNIQSGQDTTVQGSNVVGTRDVAVHAGQNLNITTAEETNHRFTRKEEKKSGLMGTGGVGFTIGSSTLKQSSDSDAILQKGSTVGSSDGHVTLHAGEQATVQGSDIIAGKDIDIAAKDVAVTAAKNSHTELSQAEQKQSGLTLALSGAVGSAVNTTVQTANEAKDTKDSRLQVLKGTQATLSGVQGYQAWQLSQADAAKAEAINQAGGEAQKPTDTIGIQLSYGSQSAKSQTRTEQTQSQGSSLSAGQDIRIKATGDSTTQDSGDIQVQGSALKAGRDMTLDAKRDIVLESAENTQTTRGENSSKGGSVGVGLTVGQGGYGIKFSAGVNKGKGHETGDGVTHTETVVDAGHQVSLKSGQDTTLKGAQVSGEKVTADVGRNLHLQSEQDKDNYDSKQQNASAGASFTYGSMSGSASVNASRDKMHSTFDSVNEQTGIFAGKGGFDVKVGEHTRLDGAVIASHAEKDKNRLDTGTLGFSDIQNKAEYKTEHQSVGISTGGAVGSQLVSNMSSNMLAGTHKHDSQSSTTHAAVSDGTMVVRDADKQTQDVADLSRDTDNAANSLSPIFDKEKEQRRLAQAQAIAEIGTQVMDIYNTHEAIKATKKATEDLKDPQTQQKLKQDAEKQLRAEGQPVDATSVADRAYQIAYDSAIREQGADIGSRQRQAVTAVIGALQGLAGGDIPSAIASGAAPYLANAVKALTYGDKTYEQLTPAEKATNLMAHAILGGVIAEMKGGSATAGATGAVSGELAASAIMSALYGDKNPKDLSPAEKETVSNLSTLAGGIAAGLVTNSTAGGVAGAQTAQNAVDANRLTTSVEKERLQTLAEKGVAPKEVLDAAACAIVKCSAQFVEGTEEWIKYKQLEEKGNSPEYAALRDQLAKETLTIDVPQPDGTIAHYAFPMFQYGKADALADNLVYADGKYQLTTRAGGLLQTAGGAVEVIGGTVSCGTGIGCAVGAVMATQGLDNMNAGSNTLVSGQPVKTMGAKGLEALGVPSEYSEITYAAIGLSGSVTTVLTSPKTGKTVTVLVDKDNRVTRSFSDGGHNSRTKGVVGAPEQPLENSTVNPIVSTEKVPHKYIEQVRTNLSRSKIDEIINTPHGQRPDPSTYMAKAEIETHLAKFNEGAVRITSRAAYKKFDTVGPDGGFVMPKSAFDKILYESKGDLRIIENKLGLDKRTLNDSDVMIIHVKRENMQGLRIPSGNEGGANNQWIPGGYTSGGVPEAVMNFSHKPPVTEIKIK